MPIFQWKARTRQGSLKKGEIEAMNEAAVMAQLRSQMLLPVTVKEKSKDVSEYLPFLKQGIKTRELVIFTRQFATMIDAGLPLVQCLDILGNQNTNKTFKEIIRTVKADVEQGSTFADALRKHPKPYDDLYVNLVQAGEIGGILDTILNRLAVYLEKADKLRLEGPLREKMPEGRLRVILKKVRRLLEKRLSTDRSLLDGLAKPGGQFACGKGSESFDIYQYTVGLIKRSG